MKYFAVGSCMAEWWHEGDTVSAGVFVKGWDMPSAHCGTGGQTAPVALG